MEENLLEKSVADLRSLAKEKGVENVTKLKKSELIEAIENATIVKVVNLEYKKQPDLEDGKGYKLTSQEDQYVEGILELLPDGYGFLRGDNYLSTPKDVYVSPVQIKRDEDGLSSIKGIYPCGEGAGYAGGITTAAMDGVKTAENIARYLKNKKD